MVNPVGRELTENNLNRSKHEEGNYVYTRSGQITGEREWDNGFYTKGCINQVPIDFLIDSGSTSSILSHRAYTKIPEEHRPPLNKVLTNVHDASGNKISTLGDFQANIELGQHEFPLTFLVCHIDQEGIIGQDFLLKYASDINYKQNIINTEFAKINCWVGTKSTISCKVIVRNTTVIPSNSACLIPVEIFGSEHFSQCGLVEPTMSKNQQCVMMPGIIDTCKKEKQVTLVNCSGTQVTVYAKQTVGTCESFENEKHNNVRIATTHQNVEQSADIPSHLTDLFERSTKHLNQNQSKQLMELLITYQSVFSKSPVDLGHYDSIQHKIHTGNAAPVRQPVRRQPIGKREIERNEVHKMLDLGVIEPSSSPWSSPIVLVTKKDGSTRFCLDYRLLNELTVKDAYPIPRVDECLESLAGSKWYSSLDLNSGFWQIGMAPEDREKTAFATSLGLFHWTVMPFGLANSPSTFERVIENVFKGLQWVELLLYMDDIISPSQSFEQGLQRLTRIFERLQEANLKLKPSKCALFQKQTKFLGHLVSENGIRTDPDKIEAVENWPTPTSAKQMKSFLGLCSYYRRFVKNFAKIARPLHKICEKGAKFIWNDDCQAAFDQLKTSLTSSPILAYPVPGKQFILDTDASNKSVGAVLSQVQNEEERVIAYMSKAMNKHEQSYCTTRKELLAVVMALKAFHAYLYAQPTLLRTDNAAVSWLRQLKRPTGQIARWIQEIETYNLTVSHRPGLKHSNADALSRRPCKRCEQQQRLSELSDDESECDETPQQTLLINTSNEPPKEEHYKSISNEELYK